VGVNTVIRQDGRREVVPHIGQVDMQTGDVFEIQTPGGGGFGPAAH
jgi:5-oxoprolinase (ATP-hydrolysing)